MLYKNSAGQLTALSDSMYDSADDVLKRAQANKITDEAARDNLKRISSTTPAIGFTTSMAKGGPVKYTKGTGPVDIGSWTAPLKTRRSD